jgi:hypothetical protein
MQLKIEVVRSKFFATLFLETRAGNATVTKGGEIIVVSSLDEKSLRVSMIGKFGGFTLTLIKFWSCIIEATMPIVVVEGCEISKITFPYTLYVHVVTLHLSPSDV